MMSPAARQIRVLICDPAPWDDAGIRNDQRDMPILYRPLRLCADRNPDIYVGKRRQVTPVL